MMRRTTERIHTPTELARLGSRANSGRMSPTTAHRNTTTDTVTTIAPIASPPIAREQRTAGTAPKAATPELIYSFSIIWSRPDFPLNTSR